jgi:DMSO/TMAO reductase YedYZ molybdopterin-dependent catalytic subunit
VSHVRQAIVRARREGPRATARRAAGGAVFLVRRYAVALVAGLLGSAAAILVMGLLRVTLGTLTLPELLGERILPLLSADQFVALLIHYQPHPKTGPLGQALLGQFLIGIVLGPLVTIAARLPGRRPPRWPSRRGWIGAGAVALAMELVALAIFWPVLPAGIAGDPPGRARLLSLLALALTFGAYAVVTLLAATWLLRAWGPYVLPGCAALAGNEPRAVQHVSEDPRMTRRAALWAAGGVALALVAGALAFDRLLAAYFARSNLAYEGMGTPTPVAPLTPAGAFYVVSKNVLDPVVVVDRWQLELGGLVNRTKTWTYAEVLALPSETRAVTLECISNGVGGNLLSTAAWHGVTLQTLLDAAGGVEPSGRYVIFRSVDAYSTSLPLADLLAARTLLAYQMNGAPLPARHGCPLRAVVPGRYGEQSVKWLTRIEIADAPYKGFYQSQGWSDKPVETLSRIDAPTARVTRGPQGAIPVGGVAYAGIRGIARVEISADGGATWRDAMVTPPLSDQSWVPWRWTWYPPNPGTYALVVRATDGAGQVQTKADRGTVPNGATGWHRVTVRVE